MQEEELDSCRAPASGADSGKWVQGETKEGFPCASSAQQETRGGRFAALSRDGLGCLSCLGNGLGILLGFGLGSELLLHLEGDRVRVHLVRSGGIAEHRGRIGP